ncbi:MAG: porin, partial [Alphaproteobacteria bacterium]|nr:porin [Alphaproteobacteria bacterium]
MKTRKILLATTALCMAAGTAAADIVLSGDAEMGVAASKDNSVRFHTDVNVKFTMTGTTDAGVEFGTNVDLNDIEDPGATSSNGSNDTTNDDDNHGGIAVHMSDPDGFGTLTLGDTDGGYDWAMIEVGSGGIRDDSEHGAWNGNGGLDGKHDGQILRWDRDIAAGFAFGASVELHDHKDNAPSNDPILGFGGTYSMGMGAGTLALGGGVQMGSFLHTIEGGLTAAQRAAEADKPVIWGTATPTPVGTVGATGSSAGASVTKGRTVAGREVEGMIVGGSAKMDFGGAGGGLSVTLNGSVMEADGSHTEGTGSAAITSTADVEKTHLGVGFGYTFGAVSLGLNVGSMATESRVDPNNAAPSHTDLV